MSMQFYGPIIICLGVYVTCQIAGIWSLQIMHDVGFWVYSIAYILKIAK
jgi:hypothetical protein